MADTTAIARFSAATSEAAIIFIYCFYDIWNGYCVNGQMLSFVVGLERLPFTQTHALCICM